jgi:hypothetical protein
MNLKEEQNAFHEKDFEQGKMNNTGERLKPTQTAVTTEIK